MTDHTWTPEVLIRYPLISRVAPSPDRSQIACTVRVPYLTDDASEFRYQLWLADRSNEKSPRLLAHGESAEQPRWSPDGSRIAFLRKVSSGTVGLWILPIDGGQPWTLTAAEPIHGDIASFCWSPDGDRIAFLAPPIDADKQKRIQRRDDAILYREEFDFAQLFITRVVGPGQNCPAPEQRTFARRHVTALAWSPDGEAIALTHQPDTLYDTWTDLRLATVPAAGDPQQPRDLGPAANQEMPPAWSPDGQWIACEASPERNGWPYAGTVRLYAHSSGDRRDLSPVSDEEPTLLGWDPEGTGVYVLNHTGVTSEIAFLPADGQDAVSVCAPRKLISSPEINQSGDLAFVAEDFDEMQSIYATSVNGADAVNAEKVSSPRIDYPEGPLPQARLLNWRTDDGLEIEGILYLPADYQPERDGRLPLLLHVHGGPTGIFQRQFSATPYYYTPAALCERGIALLRCNPRGSGGYGKAFRFANVRDWGGGDYGDLQQGVDIAIEMGIADPERLGIAGWSYGGFMTSWTITQTSRFKAASIGAAVTNPATFCGTADIPSFMPDYFGGEPWEIAAFYTEHSPITFVANAKTPSIIQHGGDDDRVPIEQGLQYYNALKRRGVPVDMYIYPRQGHAITEPRLLADAIRRNLEWFTNMLVEDPERSAVE